MLLDAIRRISPARVHDFRRARRARAEAEEWRRSGGSGPLPAALKHDLLRAYGKRFGVSTLVETGTYLGDTVAALRADFRRIISIELSDRLYRWAQRRFAGVPGVTVVHGDSAHVLPRVLSELSEPCLFWLDGHYSAEITAHGGRPSPVIEELEAILRHSIPGHVVLIDDARCFDGSNGWPTVDELRSLVERHDPRLDFSVADDIIRIHAR